MRVCRAGGELKCLRGGGGARCALTVLAARLGGKRPCGRASWCREWSAGSPATAEVAFRCWGEGGGGGALLVTFHARMLFGLTSCREGLGRWRS